MTSDRQLLVLVGATRNEARNVPMVMADLACARDELRELETELELIVIDDASTDDTVKLLHAEAQLRGIQMQVFDGPGRGLSQAITSGLRLALQTPANLIGTIDFDGQHDPIELPALVAAFNTIQPKPDCVFGSRFLNRSTFIGVTAQRRILSHTARIALRAATRMRLPSDPTTSFRVSSPTMVRSFLDEVPIDDLGGYEFFFWFAVYVAATGSFADVPICFRPRLAGTSKMDLRKVGAAAATLREIGGRAREWRRQRLPDGGFPAYPTEFLDSLGELEGYNSFLVDSFAAFVRGDVLEVGAGTGTVTTRLASLPTVNSVTAIEPDSQRFEQLAAAVARSSAAGIVTPILGTIAATTATFDTVLYCNSAEHIRDLIPELRQAALRCAPDAHLVVFGPAHEALYSEIDRVSGHWRRFVTTRLGRDLRAAGFEIVHSQYVDPVGAIAYFVGGRLGGVSSLSPELLAIYERLVLPITRLATPVTRRFMGKNVLVVARLAR
ncbi:MAG: glycosyltransferase [Actinobacteria bacterium]|nr:glycosyltransferase [Actinomycetota bacterium]